MFVSLKMMMSKTCQVLIKMIIEGKTGEEYKKLLAGLDKSERKEVKEYEKKFKETKLAQRAAENFFNVFGV